MRELSTQISFTDREKALLADALGSVRSNPYTNFGQFDFEVGELALKYNDVFLECRERTRLRSRFEQESQRAVHLHNCPVDLDLPSLPFRSPVEAKRKLKHSFMGESFMLLYAKATGQEIFGYQNTNDGDLFGDVLPAMDFEHTQSQKSAIDLGFHNDDANHYARPVWVSLLGLRIDPEFRVLTHVAMLEDIIGCLTSAEVEVLRQAQFTTPHDELTELKSEGDVAPTLEHAVLVGNPIHEIRYFEGRTRSASEEARMALVALRRSAIQVKSTVELRPGDFLNVPNLVALHGREVISNQSSRPLRDRWVLKTAATNDLLVISPFTIDGNTRVVDG